MSDLSDSDMRYIIDDELQSVVNELEIDIKAKTETFKEFSHEVRELIKTLIEKYYRKGQKDVINDIQGLQVKLLDCLEQANDLLLHYSWHMYLSKPPRKYMPLAIPNETYNLIKQFIGEHPEAGYTSVGEVVREALRRKIEEMKSKNLERP